MPRKLTINSVLAMVVLALVIYHPVFKIGFDLDDWGYMESLLRLGPSEFISRSFNLTMPDFLNTYRPLQGLLLAIEYFTFGSNPWCFHFIHILLHLSNVLLLFLICWHVSHDMRLAVLAGMAYASLPAFCQSVFLISATDVLATFFCLLTVGAWIVYLRRRSKLHFTLAMCAFVLGLLSKEFVITLPLTLLLVDLLLIRIPVSITTLVKRYFIILSIACFYMVLELYLQPRTVNYAAYGMALGPHILANAIHYLIELAFPWDLDFPYAVYWSFSIAVALLLATISINQRSSSLVFLILEAIINILPYLGLQNMIRPRFLYAAGIVPSVLIALLLENVWRTVKHKRYASVLVAFAAIIILTLGATGISDAAQADYDHALSYRAPFRYISQQHPSFPPGTWVYLVNSPTSLRMLSGMFYLRYGDKVTLISLDNGQPANLRAHQNSLIYYFDDAFRGEEILVDKTTATMIAPEPPVRFGSAIQLEGYEVSSSTLRSGQSLLILLYWRATSKVDADYTVFVHLVDSSGNMVDGLDRQPRDGQSPTSSWKPNTMIIDTLLMPVSEELLEGERYHLELGLYHLPTMQRLLVTGQNQVIASDHVIIAPFTK